MAKKKKKFKKNIILLLPLLIAYYVSSFYFVRQIYFYNSSKSFMTYIVNGIVILTGLSIVIFTFSGLSCIKKNKTKKYIIYYLFIILFLAGEIFISYNIKKVNDSLTKITNKNSGYSTSLIALKESNIKSEKDIDGKKIGIIDDENNIEGYVLAYEIIDELSIPKENLVTYDDFNVMLSELYDKKIDMIFVSSSYVSMFSTIDEFNDIGDVTNVVYKKSRKNKKIETQSTKTLTEPFSVLIMGVDSDANSLEKSNSFNGDTLILITFNPNTMNATILSIPRDTRVPIACTKYKSKNKINSSAYYGADCVVQTVSELTDINIDYWVKVNFQGVVSLVDAIGGIDINVPYAFCEQNSKRKFGNSTIYVEEGFQTLNGEQALAFARNRHTWPQYCGRKYSNYTSNDFVRGQNQQLIIKAILTKIKKMKSLSEIYTLLDVMGENIDTNIDKDIMITGFDTFKKIIFNSKNINNEDFVGTQRLYLSGYDHMIDNIYYFEYYEKSLNEIKTAIKINLELEEPVMDKEFSFSINNPYEETQIGKGTY